MSLNKKIILDVPKRSFKNKSLIKSCNNCGCYNCKNIISSKEIKIWTDNWETAICPKCGIDSIIPESSDFKLNEEFLSEVHDYWLKQN
jgi:hypothetical protein